MVGLVDVCIQKDLFSAQKTPYFRGMFSGRPAIKA
jgi:hypothetical protein